MLAVVENSLLHIMNDSGNGAFIVVGDGAQGRMPHKPGTGEMQRGIQTGLRHMIDARDIGQGHPGINGCDIAHQDALMLLLKLLIGPKGADGGEEHTDQSQTEKKADAQKLDACSQVGPLLLRRFGKDVAKCLDVTDLLS